MGIIAKTLGWGLAGIVGLAIIGNITAPPPRGSTLVPATTAPPPIRPIERFHATASRWYRDAGVLGRVDLVLTNDNDFAVKDPLIECEFSGVSGTVISRKSEIVYETVPANGNKTVRNLRLGFISDQSRTGRCYAISVQRL